MQYSPDGKRLLAVGDMYSGVVQMWDVDGRKELFQIAGPKPTRRADGERDMAFLAEEYALLDPAWKTLHLPTRGEKSARVEKDGKTVRVVENLGRVRRWDLTTKKELEPYNPPKGWGNLMTDLSPGGRFLYSIEHKDTVQDEHEARLVIYDTTTGERVAILEGSYGSLPMFLPGDKAIALARFDKQSNLTVRIHSLPAGKEVVSKTLPGPIEWAARMVDVTADGKRLAVNLGGKKDKPTTTLFLDAKSLDEVARWTGPARPIYFGHTDGQFTPDGKRFLVIDGENTLNVFDLATKKVTRAVKLEGTPMRLTVSGDGRWFATHWMPDDPNKFAEELNRDPQSMPQPRVVLVDLSDPESKPLTLVAPRGTAWGMAFRPDGKQLALGGSGGVHLFDLTTAGK